tara:strand:+ start:2574 stop:3257 length:684 start_codon:yes stop_codon:yes gene_type:complete
LNKITSPIIFIPARGGSKRIKNKNMKKLGRFPLLYFPLEIASQLDGKTIVSTDSSEIASYAKSKNAIIHNRPKKISKDSSTIEEAVQHFLNEKKIEFHDNQVLIILSACSPFLKVETIKKALKKFKKSTTDCLISTHESYEDYWVSYGSKIKRIRENEPRRQQDRRPFLVENSSFYITTVDHLKSTNLLIDGRIENYNISTIEGFDINNESDLQLARLIKKNLTKFE